MAQVCLAAAHCDDCFHDPAQITLWGPTRFNINDYAAKSWAGLTGDYYGPRWALHSRYLVRAVATGRAFNTTAYTAELEALEDGFNFRRDTVFPVVPVGDPVAIARAIADVYAPAADNPRGYVVRVDADAAPPRAGTVVDMLHAWGRDAGALSWLCDTDPACLGFNSNG